MTFGQCIKKVLHIYIMLLIYSTIILTLFIFLLEITRCMYG